MTIPAERTTDEWMLDTLVELLSPEQLRELRAVPGDVRWDVITQRAWTTDELILEALARRFRMRVADLSVVSPNAGDVVPEQLARKFRVVPLAVSESAVELATCDPCDPDCEQTLAFALGRTVRLSLAAPAAIRERLDALYPAGDVLERVLSRVAVRGERGTASPETPDPRRDDAARRASERPMVQLVDRIVAEGIQARASDIHLESEEGGVTVRYRIDGVLRQVMVLPRVTGIPLVSRVKIMAQLDIADRLRPQDGRARVTVDAGRVDLRVSTLPASDGEKVVIRILDQRATVLSLDALGMHPAELHGVQALLQSREGMVLVTGPTGSGKTTTLYSMLRAIQSRAVNIVTVEDPVEYRLQGVVQVQVRQKAGLTFPAALRSILRQDPDVILVGEVRDHETASIAVQASLTGHLVLTTLHTIDAASAVTRLMDIGVESYKIAASLKGVVSQRLLRRLCTRCRQPSSERVAGVAEPWLPAGTPHYRAAGCSECADTGYHGRLAAVEVLTSSPEIERAIAEGSTPERIEALARAAGTRSHWEAGVRQVLDGATSAEELLRVLEAPPAPAAPPPAGPG